MNVGRRSVAVALLVAAVVLCAACAEPRSDRGYEGTWALRNDRVDTRVAIVPRSEGGYRFRLSQTTADGMSVLKCDWDGRCVQTVDGAVAARFLFTPWIDPGTGLLRVRCVGGPNGPEAPTIVYENELVVADDGLSLTSFTIERAGQSFAGEARPKRVLEKWSDRVEDPPADVR